MQIKHQLEKVTEKFAEILHLNNFNISEKILPLQFPFHSLNPLQLKKIGLYFKH